MLEESLQSPSRISNALVINDVHCGEPIELMTIDELNIHIVGYAALGEGHEALSIGDNIGLANCKKSEVKKYEDAWDIFKMWSKSITMNFKHIDGNHEQKSVHQEVIIREFIDNVFGAHPPFNVAFYHGDFLKWGSEKAKAYRSKKHGAGWFKRNVIVWLLEQADKIFSNRVTDDLKKRALWVAKEMHVNIVVCGHLHVKAITYVALDDYKYLVVLPRGLNKIDYKLLSECRQHAV